MNCQFESNVFSWLFITKKRDKDDNSLLFTNIVIRFNDITRIMKKRYYFIPSLNYILFYTQSMHGLRSLCRTLLNLHSIQSCNPMSINYAYVL